MLRFLYCWILRRAAVDTLGGVGRVEGRLTVYVCSGGRVRVVVASAVWVALGVEAWQLGGLSDIMAWVVSGGCEWICNKAC